MTAVAALGVYRAYRHVLHDRVRSCLGLYHAEDEDYEWVDADERTELDAEPTPSAELQEEPTTPDQRLELREPKMRYQPSG